MEFTMNYLVIKDSFQEVRYVLTENFEKPYIKVNNSILPITTNTTNGAHLKARGGVRRIARLSISRLVSPGRLILLMQMVLD